VADYGLGDRGSIPDIGGGFLFYPLRSAGSGFLPSPCTMGTGFFSPRVKCAGRDADHSPPTNAEVKTERGYTSFPPKRLLWRIAGFVCVCVCVPYL
jgi:hypothetical protein